MIVESIPKDILKCRAVSREINFSSTALMNKFRSVYYAMLYYTYLIYYTYTILYTSYILCYIYFILYK